MRLPSTIALQLAPFRPKVFGSGLMTVYCFYLFSIRLDDAV